MLDFVSKCWICIGPILGLYWVYIGSILQEDASKAQAIEQLKEKLALMEVSFQ